jgi:hypothetical protein
VLPGVEACEHLLRVDVALERFERGIGRLGDATFWPIAATSLISA